MIAEEERERTRRGSRNVPNRKGVSHDRHVTATRALDEARTEDD